MAYQAITSFKRAALFILALSDHVSAALSSHDALDTNAIANPATIEIRALPNAPDGYSPADEDCPSARPVIRTASKLSPNETSWLEQRRGKTVGPMRDFLGRINITGFDAAAYISDHAQNFSALPNIAIAVSGGGYRAMLNGAGALQAFDSREQNSTVAGHLGGLLQSSTYLAGLSGGGWLVGSIFVNNYTTISNLLHHPPTSSVWEFGNSIFKGPASNGSSLLDVPKYFDNIYQAVADKAKAGFQTSITDYWGRALSYQLVNATDGGPSYTWSSIAKEQNFATGDTPLPLLVADGRAPGETVISANSTVFEFSPWEFGTFDPTIFGFAPLEFLGSNFSNGALPSGLKCVRGFDNAGYVMGTSSSLFNSFLLLSAGSPAIPDIPDIAKKFVTRILQTLNQTNNDIADYSPNPFYGYHNTTNLGSQSERLTLVDGGEDLQNIPLHPLIQPTRLVDVIFAVDSSADTNSSWPNGASLVATYERSRNNISNGTSFPAVPDINTFLNHGLNARPTFFGCNSSNTTGPTPLVVYIPNAPYVYLSNVSTFDPSYNNSERDAIVANGYAVATLGNGTVDSQWSACVGCAILSRSLGRTRTSVPDVCQQCFKRYCWDGTVNSTNPAPYQPKISIAAINVKSSGPSERIQMRLFSVFGIAILAIAILGL